MNVAFPYRFDARLRTAEADHERHIRDLMEQLLFTSPGERVNRPDFGSGLLRLVFEPNSGELTAATQMMVQGALQQWLGELVHLEAVEVSSQESTLHVKVRYLIRRSGVRRVDQFTRSAP